MEGKRRRILLVDDNIVNLDIGRKLLSEFYSVIPATSSDDMFKVLEKIKPEIILLDVVMPIVDGFEAIKRLKADERYCEIPVIFLTAHSESSSEAKGYSLGAVDFVMKPFEREFMYNCIEKHLGV